MQKLTVVELNELARQLRRDIMKMLMISKSGHSGGPLGLADIFASLYFNILNIDPKNPTWKERDFFFSLCGSSLSDMVRDARAERIFFYRSFDHAS